MDAGWYIDPSDPRAGRYHDGAIWTEMTVDIPQGKTLPRSPQAEAPQPPSGRSGAALVPVSQGPLSPPPSNRPKAGASSADEAPSPRAATTQPGLAKPPKPANSNQRLMILLGVLVVGIIAAGAVYLVKHHNDDTTTSGSTVTATTTPESAAASSACRLAFAQELSNPSPSGIPGTFLSCSPQQWKSAYVQASTALGQTHVDGDAALKAGCLTLQAGTTQPAACAGVAPPTPGH